MIRKLFSRIFRARKASGGNHGPARIPGRQHGLSREKMSAGCLRVIDGLQEKGFDAYIVGGAVRDALLGLTPKDFDVATNATPEQVRSTFRRSRIIGRRFQIVHVMMGRETIEVTTFRGPQDETSVQKDAHGRILRDNVFGTLAEDAGRRDLTVNALYYDPTADVIVDYHHGVADLEQKTLRMIGNPAVRYREDPVRMLRAVRFAAKLGLVLDPAARAPIREMADLLENVPPSRLFDEMLKLLVCGHAVSCVQQLRDEGLHHGLLPLLDVIFEQPLGERFVMQALANTDARVHADKTISPGFLFATLLWHEVLARWQTVKQSGEKPIPALHIAMDEVLAVQCEKLALTRKISGDIKEIWILQPRFEQRAGKRPFLLLEQPRYRAGYDFLLLRAQSGEAEQSLADWWTRFMDADDVTRQTMLVADTAPAKKRRRRRKPGPAADA
jgi:poly(A) polymerase